MPLASALQTWQLTVKTLLTLQLLYRYFTFQNWCTETTSTIFHPNTFIGGNNSRARCFLFACFQPHGYGPVVQMIQLRALFFMNVAPAPDRVP